MTLVLTGPTAEVRDQRDAIDKLEGLPRPPERTGSAADALVPPEYYEGAFGWTAHACHYVEAVDEETGEPTGEATLEVPDHLAAEHQGQEAVLDDGRTVVVDLSGAEHVEDPAREYLIILGREGDGYRAEAPSVLNAVYHGATSEEVVRNVKALVLEALAPLVRAGQLQLEAVRFTYAPLPT